MQKCSGCKLLCTMCMVQIHHVQNAPCTWCMSTTHVVQMHHAHCAFARIQCSWNLCTLCMVHLHGVHGACPTSPSTISMDIHYFYNVIGLSVAAVRLCGCPPAQEDYLWICSDSSLTPLLTALRGKHKESIRNEVSGTFPNAPFARSTLNRQTQF